MDRSTGMPDDAPPSGTIVIETRTVRRPLARNFWFAAVLVPVLITIGVGASRGSGIEQALKKDVLVALEAAGLETVGVVLDGRMVTAEVPTGVDADDAKKVVEGVDGVSAVSVDLVYASHAEARTCTDLQDKLDAVTGDQRIPFVGRSTQLTAQGAAMVKAAGKLLDACETAVVYVGGHTDPSTRFGSTISLERARVMTRLLKLAGIDSDRLEARGYGDQFPIEKSSGRAGRALNERGSIIVRSQ